MNSLPAMYPMFAAWARKNGLDAAIASLTGNLAPEDVAAMKAEYQRAVAEIEEGYPYVVIARPENEWWYTGPQPDDQYWPAARHQLVAGKSWGERPLQSLEKASSKVLAYTHPPHLREYLSKGLVVGYVQSGKTTNFTAVAAKAADSGYRLIIVLSGIHNGLRRQTQERLWHDLVVPSGEQTWYPLTKANQDFHALTLSAASLLHGNEKPMLCVVKKNATVLQRLIDWLAPASDTGMLDKCPSLIIDDEADQASVATKRINPLIRELLELLPRAAYVGYTATPFANVLIDPTAGDLYPERFILNIPRPDGYFGPETIFGRDIVEGDEPNLSRSDLDGYDMVRLIPDDEAMVLRPAGKKAVADFAAEVTPSLSDAVLYFLLATAAKHVRGHSSAHSSMLIHTSVRVAVHTAFRSPLNDYLQGLRASIERRDDEILARIHDLWSRESAAVPNVESGRWANAAVPADALLTALPDVLSRCRVILDNCWSDDRLDYTGSEGQVVIAVGGNTLSRGLTLEGLVVSFFVRAASTYDTLMQMGRWFGFRPGYEDLPRIWMTAQLEEQFRHLATVEHDMRADIERYEAEIKTPQEVAVRIRTHPSLLVTAKMGAARLKQASYSDTRVQPRYFKVDDHEWLARNLAAAQDLVAAATAPGEATPQPDDRGAIVLCDVDRTLILNFLKAYSSHEDSPYLDRRILAGYIERENRHSSLLYWNVALMGSRDGVDGRRVVFSGDVSQGTIVRSRLAQSERTAADIKTLMSKEDLVVDIDISQAAAKATSEDRLYALRNANASYHRHGLLLLYPIDRVSLPADRENDKRRPLDAVADVVAAALVFPKSAAPSDASYIAVDLSNIKLLDEDIEAEPLEAQSVELDTEGGLA